MQEVGAAECGDDRPAEGAAAPLVPAEVTLATFPWAPARLEFLSSHPLALAQAAEPFRALVLLIAHAWRKVPAMTVPNDDVQMASMAGFGRDVAAWLAVRDAVMHEWILCADNRWHHPELAAWALQSWEAKRKDERFKALQSARARSRKPAGSVDESVDGPGSAAAQPYKKEQENDTRLDLPEEEGTSRPNHPDLWSASVDASAPSASGEPWRNEDRQGGTEADAVVEVFEHWRRRTARPHEKLTASRRRIIQLRLDEGASTEELCSAIDGAMSDDFLQGRTPKNTQRLDTLDVIFKDRDRILRLANRASASQSSSTLKPAARRTAESLLALIGTRKAGVIDMLPRPDAQDGAA
jgi:hypothetical protein